MTPSIAAASLPPRFLLPALSPAWRIAVRRVPRTATAAIRNASTSSSSRDGKPIVLEKPARFNPPSHGSRLPRNQGPKHYGGNLTDAELKAQKQRDYPGMPPPKGSKAHGIIHSRTLHLCISLGTLAALAIFTFTLNFTQTSRYKHLLPEASEFWSSPIQFVTTWIRVIQLHEKDRNERVLAQHTRHTDDVAKRAYYRKVHGLDRENPVVNFFKTEEQLEEERKADLEAAAAAVAAQGQPDVSSNEEGQKRKKWLGIF